MAKHNRNQTRKLFQREVATAIKDVCKKGKKAVTPEGLKARFNHLISNQSDVDAIANYGPAFERAYFKANGSTAVQLKNLLQTQLEQLEKLANPAIKTLTTGKFKGLYNKLKKLLKA
ncbi:MAG: hypothetical protein CMF61_07225 [Magnetococcales bacterium]|nr:hypothetical protein [Magnetococcales bacterium]|tara:strand:- start:1052 stop:1402 length:351 start_codon:yes stop_codon:yes gene_type:complete